MNDSIDGLHGKPNSTRIIVYENKYDEDGLLIGMTARSEIIMCRDCKHHDPKDKKCDCGHSILWQLPRNDDWFCADAERRPT